MSHAVPVDFPWSTSRAIYPGVPQTGCAMVLSGPAGLILNNLYLANAQSMIIRLPLLSNNILWGDKSRCAYISLRKIPIPII